MGDTYCPKLTPDILMIEAVADAVARYARSLGPLQTGVPGPWDPSMIAIELGSSGLKPSSVLHWVEATTGYVTHLHIFDKTPDSA